MNKYPREQLPEALTGYITDRSGYDYLHHAEVGSSNAAFVGDEVTDRFCVLGSADDHVAKLRELADAGVDQFNIYLMNGDEEGGLEAYGTDDHPGAGTFRAAARACAAGPVQAAPSRPIGPRVAIWCSWRRALRRIGVTGVGRYPRVRGTIDEPRGASTPPEANRPVSSPVASPRAATIRTGTYGQRRARKRPPAPYPVLAEMSVVSGTRRGDHDRPQHPQAYLVARVDRPIRPGTTATVHGAAIDASASKALSP